MMMRQIDKGLLFRFMHVFHELCSCNYSSELSALLPCTYTDMLLKTQHIIKLSLRFNGPV